MLWRCLKEMVRVKQNDEQPYKKPPLWVRIFLWGYGFFWLNMIFVTGLNSLYLGYIDYDSGSLALALTLGFWLIFKYLPRLL